MPLLKVPSLQDCYPLSPPVQMNDTEKITNLRNLGHSHGHRNCCTDQNPRPKGTEFSFFKSCQMLDVLPGGKVRGHPTQRSANHEFA